MVFDHDTLGMTWPVIAAKYRLTLRTAQRWVASYRVEVREELKKRRPVHGEVVPSSEAIPPLQQETLRDVFDVDHLAEARAMLDGYETSIARLEALALTSTQESCRVGAESRLIETRERRFRFLQELRLLPPHLGTWAHVDRVADLVGSLEQFAREELDERQQQRLLAHLGGQSGVDSLFRTPQQAGSHDGSQSVPHSN